MQAGLLLAFDDERTLATALADALGVPLALVQRHRFPDGESRLRLPPALPAELLLLRGLHQPNDKLVELLIAAPAARALGAQRIVLVSPYLAYMRQDMAFTPGEAVSQRHIAALLAAQVDGLIPVRRTTLAPCTKGATVSRRTCGRRPLGIRRRRSKSMPRRRIVSAACTPMAKVFQRTLVRPSPGIGKRRSKEMPRRRATLGTYTPMARAFPRTPSWL